jgi:4-amino-4-deoxy-L-arabinose transferase-like glycosyltransferase
LFVHGLIVLVKVGRNISDDSKFVNFLPRIGRVSKSQAVYNRATKYSILTILLLAALGLLFRESVIDHGFPDVNEEATPVRQAWEMWDWETHSIDLNPRFFNYPALSFYINWVAQGLYRLATDVTGLREWGPSDRLPRDLVLIGRILGILFSLGISTVTYLLGRKLMPAVWAAWAAVVTFCMPILFHYSLLSVVDLPLGFFSILVLNALIRRKPLDTTHHLKIGVLIGLAASCKYTGVLLAIPYLLLHFSANKWDLRAALSTSGPWLAGLVTIAVFFTLNPFILLDYETFSTHFSFERQHMTVGHFGRLRSPLSEYGWTLWLNVGPLLLVSLVAGTAGALRSSRRSLWIPLIGFALFFPCFLVFWSTSFGHLPGAGLPDSHSAGRPRPQIRYLGGQPPVLDPDPDSSDRSACPCDPPAPGFILRRIHTLSPTRCTRTRKRVDRRFRATG